MPSLLQAALRYRALGLSVIPIDPHSKLPIVKWRAYQERLPLTKEIRQWWTDRPDANVAIITGRISGLVVVDVDVKGGADVAREMADSGTKVIARTGGGGAHLFYAYPKDAERVGNRANVRLGVDVRGDGGYVVAAPSIHSSGKPYKWTKPFTRASLGRLKAAPSWTSEPPNESVSVGTTRWLEEAYDGVSSGSRNSTATRLAGYYIKKEIPPDVVRRMLSDWNSRNEPPLTPRELDVIVDSVHKTHQRNTRGQKRTNTMVPNESGDPFSVVGVMQYMAQFRQDGITWTIPGWMPEQTIAMVVAPPGSYKTWMLIDAAISIASGVPFLGSFPVEKKGPVIIVQQEDFHGQMAERMSIIWRSRMGHVVDYKDPFNLSVSGSADHTPLYLHPDRRLRFDDSVVLDSMEQKIHDIRPSLVIIDPLYSTGSTDDFMAKTVQNMFRLKSLRDTYGCSFLIAHHTAKASVQNPRSQREEAWGSQFLNAFLETGWQIRQQERPHHVLVRRHFKVAKDAEETVFKFDIDTETTEGSYSVSPVTAEHTTHEEASTSVIEHMQTMRTPQSVNDMSSSLGRHRSSVLRQLQKLETMGRVRRTEDGCWELMQSKSKSK